MLELAQTQTLTPTPQRLLAPGLFDTNEIHKIIIPMKTKEKRFSIRYKFALRSIGNQSCPSAAAGRCHTALFVRTWSGRPGHELSH